MLRPKPARRIPRRRPSLLLTLRRHPRLWWVVTGAIALASALVVASVVAQAEAAREGWGATEDVLVAVGPLEAGDPIYPSDVAVRARPVATLPASALRHLPTDAVAGAPVVEGEVLVAERLAGAGRSPAAVRLPPGTRAVAIPAEAGLTPPLAVGDLVDVLVALAGDEAERPPGFTLVDGAAVVAVDDDAVTVAVPRADAPRVAVALGAGAVTLALVGQE